MTFEEICKLDPFVLSFYQEATAFRVILENGYPGRIWDAERAAKLKPDPNYCKTQLWAALPPERGEVGLERMLDQCVGPGATVEALRTAEAKNICKQKFLADMPPCQHEPDKIITVGGIQIAESLCTYSYPLPPIDPEKQNKIDDGTCVMVNRLTDGKKTGFSSVIDRLKHAGGGPEPEPVDVTPIADDSEPIFIVRDKNEAKQLFINLEIAQRWRDKQISTWYAANCIHTCSEAEAEKIIAGKYKKGDVIGGLGWKPVVLTFSNPKLSNKLSELGVAITEMDFVPDSLEYFRTKVTVTSPTAAQAVEDLPESALDGRLGEICQTRMSAWPRAYAWPALLTVAGALVDKSPVRTNLFVGLIGKPGTGKSTAIRRAIWLLGMAYPVLLEEKFGSFEGLAKRIGAKDDAARLWFPDELGHTMKKAQISHSTFAENLQTSWDSNKNTQTIAKQEVVEFSCRLSVVGGIITDGFGDAFGSATTGGLWHRFIFAECPSGFVYHHRNPVGNPEREIPTVGEFDDEVPSSDVLSEIISLDCVDPDVEVERDRWQDEGIDGRVCDNALRVAAICAAWDGRGTLRAADLGPALAFARYQEKMRGMHKPNPGRNESAIVHFRLKAYIDRHSPNGEWLERSRTLQDTNVYEFGLNIIENVLRLMESTGEIEQKKQGRKRMLRKLV